MSDDMLNDLIQGEREALVPGAEAKKATWARVAHSVSVAAPPAADPSAVTSPVGAGAAQASWTKVLLAIALGGTAIAGMAALSSSEPAPPLVAHGSDPASDDAGAPASKPVPDEPPLDEPPPDELPPIRAAVPTELRPPTERPTPAVGSDDPAPDEAIANDELPPSPAPATIVTGAASDAEPAIPPSRLPAKRPAPPTSGQDTSEPARVSGQGPQADPVPPAASNLAEEARLVAAARRSIQGGAFDDALRTLADHARRFPAGQLREDRIALQARAHCGAGDQTTGLEHAAKLRASFPKSSKLARVGRACDDAPTP